MLVKTIEYEDFNGVSRKESFMFHMSKADVIRLEASLSSPEEFSDSNTSALERVVNKFVESRNIHEIVTFFEDLIKRSYGVKSDDGRSFLKNEQLAIEFMQSPAYDVLLLELLSDENSAIVFFTGMMPNDIRPDDSDSLSANVHRG